MLSPRSRLTRCVVVLALVVGAEAVAAVVAPGAPPIYDGVGFPDEPYRFVAPPPGYRDTKPPTTATGHATLANGTNSGQLTINSGEIGPQLSLFLDHRAIRAPAAAQSATVTAAPQSPAAQSPAGRPIPGYAWSNVYRITVTSDAGDATLVATGGGSIQMRSPSPQQPGPRFYADRGGTWTALKTFRVGTDIYQADLVGATAYVLASHDRLDLNAKNPNDEGNVGIVGFLISGLGVVIVIVLFVRAERRRSRRRTLPAPH